MYIDSVIMRDDTLTSGGSGTLSRTMLYAQNWLGGRGDVVGMLRSDGSPYEHVRYSAYGRPVGISAADWNGSGALDGDEVTNYLNAWNASDPWADFDLDGPVLTADIFAYLNDYFEHVSSGRDKLHSGSKNRIGYAGYQYDDVIPHMQLARHRWYRADLQTWTRRDPLGEVDGPNLYQYVQGNSIDNSDPSGLLTSVDIAFRACMKQPTKALQIECLEKLLNIFPGTKWDASLRRIIDSLKRRPDFKPKPKYRRGLSKECLDTYARYKALESVCFACKGGDAEECESACAKAVCWGAVVAYRKAYDNKYKCPAPNADHPTALKNAQGALAKCMKRCGSAECKEIIDPKSPDIKIPDVSLGQVRSPQGQGGCCEGATEAGTVRSLR